MSLRNVTLTAVAALSLGMAANAQTTRITVPVTEPGAPAPAAAAAPAPAAATVGEATPANPAALNDAATAASADRPAKAADAEEAATAAQTGTAAGGMDVTTPTPTPSAGEPPAAPKEGLPASAAEAQVNAPVPAAEGAAEADAPGSDKAPASAGGEAPAASEPAATATPSPAEVSQGRAPVQPVPAEGATASEPAAPAETAPAAADGAAAPATDAPATDAAAPAPAASVPANAQNPDQVNTDTAATDAGSATQPAAAAEGEHEAPAAHAAHQEIHDVAFSFEGPFGKYDQFQLQRGLQIYTEVCSACHGLKQVPLRTLHDAGGPGLPEDQMRAYAHALTIPDPATGEDRPREPTDYFPTITGEGMGPDLSLMAKARAGFHGPYGTGISQLFNGIGGPEYIYSILTGYTGKTKEQAGATFYENKAFPGGWISMPPPLSDEQVTFEDGSPNDMHSEAKDIAAFLMWAAEPKMMARKQAGLVSVLFLVVLSALLYLTNKRLWWPLKHRRDVIGDGR